MWTNSICRSTTTPENARLVSSGPLSQRIAFGCPRSPQSPPALASLFDWRSSCPLPKPNTPACTHPPRSAPGSLVRTPRHHARNPAPTPDSPPSSSAAVARSRTVFAFLPPNHQPGLAIDPMRSLVLIRSPHRRSSTCSRRYPKTWFLPRQLQQSRAQRFVRPPRLITVSRDRHPHQAARSSLTEGILLPHLPDSCLQSYELQPFFRITDCNASLSRLRSATSFRSRLFSSRNCLASWA